MELLRPLYPTRLLISVVAAMGTMIRDFDSAVWTALGSLQQGAVGSITVGALTVAAYRCNHRDKIASLRFLAVEGATPAADTAVVVAVATLPRFSGKAGWPAGVPQSPSAPVAATGVALARLSRFSLATDGASILSARSVEPFTGTAYPGGLTNKALRAFKSLTFSAQDSKDRFLDSTHGTGVVGDLLADLTNAEFLLASVESIASGASVGGVVAGIDVEAQ